MKKFSVTSIISLILSIQTFFSQSYFGDVNNVTLYYPQEFQGGTVYFGLEEINTVYLDIAVTQLQGGNRYGQWNLNNGNGTYGNINLFSSQGSGNLIGNVFVKLRSASTKRDMIVGRSDGLEVRINDGGSIGDPNNYNGGPNWTHIETGIFSTSDILEDVLFSNGSNRLYYFVNNNNGTLQGPNYIDLPNQIHSFKIRQLNEKTDGYVQVDPDDRSDITYTNAGYPSNIYAYKNNEFSEFAGFSTYIYEAKDLEVADLDGDGYNDVILVGNDTSFCPSTFEVGLFRNIQGHFIYSSAFWSYVSDVEYSCATNYKIRVADLNKDGLNDLILAWGYSSGSTSYIKVIAFINQNTTPLFTSSPQVDIDINAEGEGAIVTQIMTSDIYGSQSVDGGGIALLVSYYVSINTGSNTEMHVKVLNAYVHQTAPPPPIVQGFLEYNQSNQIWHPHIHLNNRGERDFDHYQIWKFNVGWQQPVIYDEPVVDTGWTDYAECVDVTGGDRPDWNCYYYAKSVDNANPIPKVSVASQNAYFTVGCIPVCDACEGGDNPLLGQVQKKISNKPHEKFSISNYPNPFNPSTIVLFTLPYASKVKITVYNSIGQAVFELVNGNYYAGTYSVHFDGKNLASGIYYCLMEADGLRQVKKMLLIK